jgi:hypothetical protein
MKKSKRSRFQRSKKTKRMVPVTIQGTGERRMMDINKLKPPNKIIHETLDGSLITRIKKVYDVLSAVEIRNSTDFEHQFKLEHHPGRELIAYEIIVNTYLAFSKGRFLFPRQKWLIYQALLRISYGYDPNDILEDLPSLTENDLYDLYVLWGREFKAYFNIHDN